MSAHSELTISLSPETPDRPGGDIVTGDATRRFYLGFGAAFALGVLTSVLYLGHSSFYLDESVSTTLARTPWHRFAQVVSQREANMALYYLVLRAWTHLGTGEAVVRSFSVLASLGALVIVVAVTRRLFGNRTAVICGVLFAVDPLIVEFAQDARGYALSVLLVAASCALFVRAVKVSSNWAVLSGYVVVSALAAYVNFWAALVPLGQAVSLLLLPPKTVPWRRWTGVGTVLVVLLVPLGLLIHATDNAGTNWAAGTSAGRVFSSVRAHVPHGVIDGVIVVALVIVGALVIAWKRRTEPDALLAQWPIVFTVSWLVVPMVLVVALSFAYKPLLVVRYLVVFFPPLLMLVAAGVARLSRRVAIAVMVVLIAASGVGLSAWYATGGGENWHGAVQYVADQSAPGDGVMIFAPYMRIPFEWYFDQYPAAEAQVHPVASNVGWGVDPLRFDYPVTINRSTVARGAHGLHVVFLVLSQAQLYPSQTRSVVAGLRSDGLVPVETRSFTGVQVVTYKIAPSRSIPSG